MILVPDPDLESDFQLLVIFGYGFRSSKKCNTCCGGMIPFPYLYPESDFQPFGNCRYSKSGIVAPLTKMHTTELGELNSQYEKVFESRVKIGYCDTAGEWQMSQYSRLANDRGPGQLLDSKIIINFQILVGVVLHRLAVGNRLCQ